MEKMLYEGLSREDAIRKLIAFYKYPREKFKNLSNDAIAALYDMEERRFLRDAGKRLG